MKKQKEIKTMSIDDLAIIVANGFDHLSGKIENDIGKLKDHVDRRMDGLELKISSEVSGWNREFDRLHEWMEELDKRVNKIEDKIVSV